MKKKLQFPLSLDLSDNHIEVDSSFSVADDITGPIYNNSYSPLWIKKEEISGKVVVDKDGNKYEKRGGVVYKNGKTLFNTNRLGFERSEFTPKSNTFDVYNNKFAYAIFDPTSHTYSIEYNGVKYESPSLFTNGEVLAERVRVVNGYAFFISLFLNDSGTYRVFIYNGRTNNSTTINWEGQERMVNISSGKPISGVSSVSRGFYEPIIQISKIDSNYVGFSICNNAGGKIDPNTFMFMTRVVNTSNLQVSNPQFASQSFQTEITNQETINYIAYVNSTLFTEQVNVYKKDDKWFLDSQFTQEITDFGTYEPFIRDDQWVANRATTEFLYRVAITGTSYLSGTNVSVDLANTTAQENRVLTGTSTTNQVTISYTGWGDTALAGPGVQNPRFYFTWSRPNTTPVTFMVPFFNQNVQQVNQYTTTGTGTSGCNPCIFLDEDGVMVSLANSTLDSNITASGNLFIGKFRVTSYNGAQLSGQAITTINMQSTCGYFRGSSFALGQGWARWCATYTNKSMADMTKDAQQVANATDYVFDSFGIALYNAGVLNDNNFYRESGSNEQQKAYSQTINALPYSPVGSRARYGNYNIVYINGLRAGISYSDDEDFIGTMVTEWNDIKSDTYITVDEDTLYYQSNDNKFYKVEIKAVNEIQYLFDRYVIVNTIDYFNGWDTLRNKKIHYASDYANRCFMGDVTYNASNNALFWQTAIASSPTVVQASGINPNYLVSGDGISSVLIGPRSFLRAHKNENFIASAVPSDNDADKIDVFYSTGTNTPCIYQYSYRVFEYTKSRSVKADLIDLPFPSAVGAYTYYTPNIFTEYLKTYNNKDSVLNGTLAYQILYANNVTPVLLFSTATQMENVQSIFCIQSQFYGVINDKIYALVYSNGTLVEQDAIIDVTGLQFLGGLPTIAYFYSKMNKSIYSFTGDANLTLLYDACKISEIYSTYYNTSTQALYIVADTGLYIIAPNSMYRLPLYGVMDLFLSKEGTIYVENSNSLYSLKYYKDEGFEPLRLKVDTKLYGGGEKSNLSITSWKVTLLNNGWEKSDTVVLASRSLTDKDVVSKTKEFKINPADWQENQVQLTFNPSLTKGQGLSLSIETPWPVVNIVAEVNADGSTTLNKGKLNI